MVRTNREHAPDFINIKVEELVGDKPFDNLDKYITQDELRALSENYKRIAGFALADVAAAGAATQGRPVAKGLQNRCRRPRRLLNLGNTIG